MEELSMSPVSQGPLPLRREFEDLEHNQSINQRLRAEQPRLTRLGIIRKHAAHVERGGQGDYGIQGAYIRHTRAKPVLVIRVRKLPRSSDP